MGFEEFKRKHAGGKVKVTAGVYSKGQIALSKGSYQVIGEPKAAILLYDKERKLVGVKPANVGDKNAYSVIAASGSFLIYGSSFLKEYGIDHSSPHRVPAHVEDGILVFDVSTRVDD